MMFLIEMNFKNMKIEMNIRKLFQRLCIPALALATSLASCTDELSSEVIPGGGGGRGEAEVTLKLQVPGAAAAAKTRATEAGTSKESSISDLYILAFKVNDKVIPNTETLDYFVRATESDAKEQKWTASLKVKDYLQTFVMVANAQGTNSKVNEQIAALAGNSVGQDKMVVLKKLTEKLSTAETTAGFDADNHPFTMYGQTGNVTILEEKNNPLNVSMHRIVARVQVTFNEDVADKFEAKTVRLYNFNDLARVIPDKLEKTGQEYEENPTIPDGATLFPKKASDNVPTYTATEQNGKMVVKEKIYLFETAQPTEGTETEKYLKRPCLIVGGEYKTEKPDGTAEAVTCYYRIDFANGNDDKKIYFPVIRNHTYNVDVTTVSGPGHDTPQDALESQPANITATVIDWADDPMDNVEFDGKYALGVGTMKYELGRRERNDLLQQVKATDGLEWTVTLCEIVDGEVKPNTQPDWISFVVDDREEKNITRIGNGALQDLNFKVTKYEGDSERRAVMRFTAGRLKVDALVVQDTSNPVFLEVVNKDGETLKEVEFKQTPDNWCEDIYIKYGPENTKLTWKFTGGGINLNTIAVNGTEQTEMEGVVSTDDQTSEGTLSLKALASAFVTNEDFITKSGLLTITADGNEGFKSHTVRLVQKKYGVSLVNSIVPCTGNPEYVYVIGNMKWEAKMAKESVDAVRHMLQRDYEWDYGIAQKEKDEGSKLDFLTQLKPLNQPAVTAKIEFTNLDDPDSETIAKPVTILGCFVDKDVTPNKYYLVYNRKVAFNQKDAQLKDIPTAQMASKALSSKIHSAVTNLGLGWNWQICKESTAKIDIWWTTWPNGEGTPANNNSMRRLNTDNMMGQFTGSTKDANLFMAMYDVWTVSEANFDQYAAQAWHMRASIHGSWTPGGLHEWRFGTDGGSLWCTPVGYWNPNIYALSGRPVGTDWPARRPSCAQMRYDHTWSADNWWGFDTPGGGVGYMWNVLVNFRPSPWTNWRDENGIEHVHQTSLVSSWWNDTYKKLTKVYEAYYVVSLNN